VTFLSFFFIVASLLSFVVPQLILKERWCPLRKLAFVIRGLFHALPWRVFDDDFVFSHARIAATIRP
jgi:hypothetical protein